MTYNPNERCSVCETPRGAHGMSHPFSVAPKAADETLREYPPHIGGLLSYCDVGERDAAKCCDDCVRTWQERRTALLALLAERDALSADLEKVQTELDVSEAECTALRATSEEQESRLMELLDRCQRAEHERDSLRSQLEEAGKDTARLDWLETACAEVRRPVADTLYVRVPECVRRNADGDCTRSRWLKPHYGNARHAIDSARLASTETE